jgi:hypothetical protein
MGAYFFGYGINPLIPEKSCNTCLPVLNYSYPPVWLYVVLGMFTLWLGFSHYSFPTNPASLWSQGIVANNIFEAYRSFMPSYLPYLDLLLKTPIIFSDLAIGYLIWRMGGQTKRAAWISLTAWILNPYTILVSTVWGEFDSLAILFMTLAAFYLLRQRYTPSAVALALGVATKIFPIALLPVTIGYIFINKRSQLLRYSASFLATTGALFSTLILFPHPLEFVERLVLGRSTPNMSGTSVFAGLTWMSVFNLLHFNPNLPMILLIFPAATALVLWRLWGGLRGPTSLIPALAIGFLPIYLSYPVVNVQYPIWIVPMLALLVLRKRIGSWSIASVSAIPFAALVLSINPLSLLSPVVVWDENNFPPASDVIIQVWKFGFVPYAVGAILFTISVLLILSRLIHIPQVIETDLVVQVKAPVQTTVPLTR